MAVTTLTVAALAGSAALSYSSSQKAAKAQKDAISAQQKANSEFQVPEVAEPPSAEEILAAYRNEALGHFKSYDKIATKASNTDNRNQRDMLQQSNPQYFELLGQLSNNASDLNQGRLPYDVQQQVTQQAAENAYLGGYTTGRTGPGGNSFAGSNNADANILLRNLGLTSLDAMKLGANLTGQVQQETRAATAPITRVSSVMPNVGIFQTGAENQAMYQQALYNRDSAVNNQGVQSDYLGALNGVVSQQASAAGQAALGQFLGSLGTMGLGSMGGASGGYTAGQNFGSVGNYGGTNYYTSGAKNGQTVPKATAIY